VMAHEIAHVTQHHLARMIAGQGNSALATLAALAVAILASRSNSQVTEAALAAAQATSLQSQLDFTREHEREADLVGLQIMTQAGFDARAMATFFGRMQRYNRAYESNAPVYLRTHPLTTQRISDIQDRLEKIPYRQVADSLDFQLVRARLAAISDSPKEALRSIEASLPEKHDGGVAYHYGLATALQRTRDFKRAEEEIGRARTAVPANAMIENRAAEIKRDAGEQSAALELYAAAVKRFPQSRALSYGYAETLLRARRADEALKFVNDRLQLTQSDYRLYEIQAKTFSALGKKLLQHQSQAEAYVRQGNLSAAVDQLQIALKSGDGDFYQLSSAEARIKELKATLSAEKKNGQPRSARY
jgi:beta-barrel assembly-enhancing protease